jgi:hypothetical protein
MPMVIAAVILIAEACGDGYVDRIADHISERERRLRPTRQERRRRARRGGPR